MKPRVSFTVFGEKSMAACSNQVLDQLASGGVGTSERTSLSDRHHLGQDALSGTLAASGDTTRGDAIAVSGRRRRGSPGPALPARPKP
jgi:hypothetical protein